MTDLSELIRRVEAATGKSTELSFDVWKALIAPDYDGDARRAFGARGPHPTGSLDAAIGLAEIAIPGACWRVEKNTPGWLLAGHRKFWATCGVPGAQEDGTGETAPLALLLAMLKALEPQ